MLAAEMVLQLRAAPWATRSNLDSHLELTALGRSCLDDERQASDLGIPHVALMPTSAQQADIFKALPDELGHQSNTVEDSSCISAYQCRHLLCNTLDSR